MPVQDFTQTSDINCNEVILEVKWLDNITDKNILQDNLTFTSLYVAVYEHMADYVVSNLKSFLCNWGIKDGKEYYSETDRYKVEIKNRIVDDKGNKDITKSSFLWLIDNDAITKADYQIFLDAKLLRNKYAHELTSVIYQGVNVSEIKLFFDMFRVYQKISKWYFINIEASIWGEDLPDDVNLSQVKTTADVMFGMILEVLYNGKSNEYKEILNNVRKEEYKC